MSRVLTAFGGDDDYGKSIKHPESKIYDTRTSPS